MAILLDVVLLIAGFVLLIQSAKIFVGANVGIAKRLRIPSMVIGLTVVALGSSAPEIVVSVSAAATGSADIAIANVVGSNMFNLLLIVGLGAAIYPISVQIKDIARDIWVSLGAALLLLAMVLVFQDVLPRYAAFILLAGFIAYMFVVVRHAMKNKLPVEEEDDKPKKPLWLSALFALLSGAALIFGGQLTVSSAVDIAEALGVTERVIGLTIVAFGTSLPELVTTIIACRKREGGFALGVVIGSNVMNIMLILGLAGLVSPLAIAQGVAFDLVVLSAGTLIFFVFARSSKKLVRLEGLAMVAIFLAYMTYVVMAKTPL